VAQPVPPDRAMLVPVASLEEFFRDSLDAALAANHVTVDSSTSRYVVNLLTLNARTDSTYEHGAVHAAERPLALLLAEAASAPSREERAFLLQRLGDIALFTAGFFADSLRDRAVGLDYYVGMGGGAYRSLAHDSRSSTRAAALAEVFAELGAKFIGLVDALNELRATVSGRGCADVLGLYDQWLSTGSPRASRLLRQAGVIPTPLGIRRYEH
jgi:hypothetical protein